ncbi:F-box protein At3g56470-like [Telopea speciosissima]|uniref:F-box protein At3g56470-like n=1 Tax=Telopea speciosissima TaxID=54955 RepID=UPI001CC674F2|nr:F-box protein At3g56470-like [Telopea speciosissima]
MDLKRIVIIFALPMVPACAIWNCLRASAEETSQEEGSSIAELHADLLETIACRLSIVDLLRFRCTCKAWRSASFNVSAVIDSKTYQTPWFFQFCLEGEFMLSDPSEQDDCYDIDIPELEDVTCIASNGGWLLLYRDDGLVFFFCPFSRARVDLPLLPLPLPRLLLHSELPKLVAAISSSPTSQDCIVCVINHRNSNTLVLNLIRRGATEWTTHEYHDGLEHLRTITCASYYHGVFYFMDSMDSLVTFSPEKIKWVLHKIVAPTLPFDAVKDYFSTRRMVEKLLSPPPIDMSVSIFICGTKLTGIDHDYYIHNEHFLQFGKERDFAYMYGVWIQPRLHYLPPSYSW